MLTTEQEMPLVKRRTKGEKTKLLILEAAIVTLAKLGIKGTTHRAIAKEADIQLSLTTYYFTDIDELILQAIIINSDTIMATANEAWLQAFELINQYDKPSLKTKSVRSKLAEELTELATHYIYQKIINENNTLSVEQILFANAQFNDKLFDLAEQHRQALLQPFISLCSYFNKVDPSVDADILLTVILQTEYSYLSTPVEKISMQDIKNTLERVIRFIMRVKA